MTEDPESKQSPPPASPSAGIPPKGGDKSKVPPKLKVRRPPTTRAKSPGAKTKSETSRIDLEAAVAASKAAEDTPFREAPLEDLQEAMKKSTVRIDSAALDDMMSLDDADVLEATKKATAKIETPAEELTRPKRREDLAEAGKKTTAPIESAFSAGQDFGEAAKKATVPIDASTIQRAARRDIHHAKKTTTRIESHTDEMMKYSDEEIANAAKKATVPIDTAAVQRAMKDDLGLAKKTTTRIDSHTDEMTKFTDEEIAEAAKKSTVRIEPISTEKMAQMAADDLTEAAKKATARVQIDDEVTKGDTQRVDAQAAAAAESQELSKKTTSRINIGEVLDEDEEEDIFKRRTAVLDANQIPGLNKPSAGPRTIRIKRPGTTPPTTTVLKKAPEPAAAPAAPVRAPAAPAAAGSAMMTEARKSETSRIDLPPEAEARPPTRRKTVRIKRPDGTPASRQIAIARAGEEEGGEVEEIAMPAEEEVGPVFSILTLVAALVMVFLIYVLAAQTIAPGLPFPSPIH